jgi:hypothetical protein
VGEDSQKWGISTPGQHDRALDRKISPAQVKKYLSRAGVPSREGTLPKKKKSLDFRLTLLYYQLSLTDNTNAKYAARTKQLG